MTADGLTTQGSVFLRGTKAKGEVRLLRANIGADLDCSNATFENPGGTALNADGLTTQGYVFLRNAKIRGQVWLLGANIGANLECTGATFENPEGTALNAEGLLVKGGLFCRSMKERPVGEINLLQAKVGQLVDDVASWPLADNVWRDGFEYEASKSSRPTLLALRGSGSKRACAR